MGDSDMDVDWSLAAEVQHVPSEDELETMSNTELTCNNSAKVSNDEPYKWRWPYAFSNAGVSVSQITIPTKGNNKPDLEETMPLGAPFLSKSDYTKLMVIRRPEFQTPDQKRRQAIKDQPKKVMFKIINKARVDSTETSADKQQTETLMVLNSDTKVGHSDSIQKVDNNVYKITDKLSQITNNVVCQVSPSVTGAKVVTEEENLGYCCPFNFETNLYLGEDGIEHGRNRQRKDCDSVSRWRLVCPVCMLNCDEVCSTVTDVWKHFEDHPGFLYRNVSCACRRSFRDLNWFRSDDVMLRNYLTHIDCLHKLDSLPKNVLFDVLFDPVVMSATAARCESFDNMQDFFMHLKAHLHVMRVRLMCRHCIRERKGRTREDGFCNPSFLQEEVYLEHLATKHSIMEKDAEPMLIALQLRVFPKPQPKIGYCAAIERYKTETRDAEVLSERQQLLIKQELVDAMQSEIPKEVLNKDDPYWVLPMISCPCNQSGCNFMTKDLLVLGKHIDHHLKPMVMRWVVVCRACYGTFPGMVNAVHHVRSRHSCNLDAVACQRNTESESVSKKADSASSLKELLVRESETEKPLPSKDKQIMYKRQDMLEHYVALAGYLHKHAKEKTDSVPSVSLMKLGMNILVRPEVNNFSHYGDWKVWSYRGHSNTWKQPITPVALSQKLKQSGNSSITFLVSDKTSGSSMPVSFRDQWNDIINEKDRPPDCHKDSSAKVSNAKCQPNEQNDNQCQKTSALSTTEPTGDISPPGFEQSSMELNVLDDNGSDQVDVSDQAEADIPKNTESAKERAERLFQEKLDYLEKKYLQPASEPESNPYQEMLSWAIPVTTSVHVTSVSRPVITSVPVTTSVSVSTPVSISPLVSVSTPVGVDSDNDNPTAKRQKTEESDVVHVLHKPAAILSIEEQEKNIQQFLSLGKVLERKGVRCMYKAQDMSMYEYVPKIGQPMVQPSACSVSDYAAAVPANALPVPVSEDDDVVHQQKNTASQQESTAYNVCPDHNLTKHVEQEFVVVGLGFNAFYKGFVILKEMATDLIFQCPFCLFSRHCVSTVARHVAVLHDAKEVFAMKMVNQNMLTGVYKFSTTYFYCRHCSFVTPHLLSMWRHFQNVHKYRLRSISQKGIQRWCGLGILACCKCQFNTNSHTSMVLHIEQYHRDDMDIFKLGYVVCKMYTVNRAQMDTLESSSSSLPVLQRLLALPHQDTVPSFLCLHCTKKFSTILTVESHCLESHGQGMVFVCKQCNFTFQDMDLLAQHWEEHPISETRKCSVGMESGEQSHTFTFEDIAEVQDEAGARDDPPVSDIVEEEVDEKVEMDDDDDDLCAVKLGDQNICVPISCLHPALQEQLETQDKPAWMAVIPLLQDTDLEPCH